MMFSNVIDPRGTGMAMGIGTADSSAGLLRSAIPLFQTNFFPDLTHSYLNLPIVLVVWILVHGFPAPDAEIPYETATNDAIKNEAIMETIFLLIGKEYLLVGYRALGLVDPPNALIRRQVSSECWCLCCLCR